VTIRLVHLFTGDDGQSHVTEGEARLTGGAGHPGDVAERVDLLTFAETPAGSSLSWHNAPARQYVITLTGTLEFETRGGERFTLRPGDVLLAEDTTGGGHRWRLVDDQPWKRVYVTLDEGAPTD
jgi:quercetin dioxygenase-like cupin family protein